MFIERYLNKIKFKLLCDVYDMEYLNSLNEDNFNQIYEIFKRYRFYFIDDIILNYLEIFQLDSILVERKILELIKELGSKYIYIIGDDLRILEKILD